MTKKIILSTFLIFGFIIPSVYSQTSSKKNKDEIVAKTDPGTKKLANAFFKDENYTQALPLYLSLQKGSPDILDYNFKLGVCYIKLDVGKFKALPYLEKAAKGADLPRDLYFFLAKGYHYVDNFQEAINNYEKYMAQFSKGKSLDDYELTSIIREIEMCKNGIALKKKALDVTFENLGPLINSKYPDYNPFIDAEETVLIYTTRRQTAGPADESGIFKADIFVSYFKEGKWTKAKSISPLINTRYDEEAVGFTGDGKNILIFSDESDIAIGDILISSAKGKSWSKPTPLGSNVNTSEYETGASISPDGKTLIFSSDFAFKTGTIGEKDLYKCTKLPDGTWSIPTNLGKVVNTIYDEDAPFIHADGKTLFFSSRGHNSMGGFDVFKTMYDEANDSWSAPENIGYPVNNADDNLYFSLSSQGKYAYICASRPEGLGDLDIYKVNFKDVQVQTYQTIIRGILSTGTSFENDAQITLLNKNNPEDYGQYKPSPQTGKYVISASPGTYMMMIDATDYVPIREEIVIPKFQQPYFIDKDIKMIKKSISQSE